MPTLLTTGFLAFLFCLVLTPLLRWLVRRWGQQRRQDARGTGGLPLGAAIPRLGGVAVLAAVAAALAVRAQMHWGFVGQGDTGLLRQLAPPVLLVLALGAADDWWNLSPRWKFAGQIGAALWVAVAGVRVTAVFHHALPLWLAYLITVVWLVGCTNAFNLIDGLDGLATGLALFATGTVLAHAVLIGEPGLALITGVLFGALAGFLLFNFPPASIYLGDAGSLSVGFLLGCMALAWANKATTMVGLMAPFFALLVPMLDTLVAIVRRGLTGQPLFVGDQSHIHHRLLRRGLRPRGAIFVLYAVAGCGAVASLLMADLRQRHTFELVILLFVVLAGVGVQQLGYTEFSGVGRLLRRGVLDPRRGLQAQASLRRCGEEIAQATNYEQIWLSLCRVAEALDFHGLEFRAGELAAPAWQRRWSRPGSAAPSSAPTLAAAEFCGWYCQVPLGPHGELGTVAYWRAISAEEHGFLDETAAVLQSALNPRLSRLPLAPQARTAASGA